MESDVVKMKKIPKEKNKTEVLPIVKVSQESSSCITILMPLLSF